MINVNNHLIIYTTEKWQRSTTGFQGKTKESINMPPYDHTTSLSLAALLDIHFGCKPLVFDDDVSMNT